MSASLPFPRGQLVALQVLLITQKGPASLAFTYFSGYEEWNETSLKFRLLQRPCLLQNHQLSALVSCSAEYLKNLRTLKAGPKDCKHCGNTASEYKKGRIALISIHLSRGYFLSSYCSRFLQCQPKTPYIGTSGLSTRSLMNNYEISWLLGY